MGEHKTCDDYVDSYETPDVLRWFLFINRLPATLKYLAERMGVNPKLFATYEGKRVRVVMASRLGDVGITPNLGDEHGYDTRVPVDMLSDFSDKP